MDDKKSRKHSSKHGFNDTNTSSGSPSTEALPNISTPTSNIHQDQDSSLPHNYIKPPIKGLGQRLRDMETSKNPHTGEYLLPALTALPSATPHFGAWPGLPTLPPLPASPQPPPNSNASTPAVPSDSLALLKELGGHVSRLESLSAALRALCEANTRSPSQDELQLALLKKELEDERQACAFALGRLSQQRAELQSMERAYDAAMKERAENAERAVVQLRGELAKVKDTVMVAMVVVVILSMAKSYL